MRKLFMLGFCLLLLACEASDDDPSKCPCKIVTVDSENFRLRICSEEQQQVIEENSSKEQATIQEKRDGCI